MLYAYAVSLSPEPAAPHGPIESIETTTRQYSTVRKCTLSKDSGRVALTNCTHMSCHVCYLCRVL